MSEADGSGSAPSRCGASLLAGNGAPIVRELALAKRVQGALERLYAIDRVLELDPFVVLGAAGEREALFVREGGDGELELSLRIPSGEGAKALDGVCQIIEGVSHFVYITHRANRDQETTQLELELQAEVDKYVVLAASIEAFDARRSEALRVSLYDAVNFSHDQGTEEGERYRTANGLARQFTGRLERKFVARRNYGEMRRELRRFFHLTQSDKLAVARAA